MNGLKVRLNVLFITSANVRALVVRWTNKYSCENIVYVSFNPCGSLGALFIILALLRTAQREGCKFFFFLFVFLNMEVQL